MTPRSFRLTVLPLVLALVAIAGCGTKSSSSSSSSTSTTAGITQVVPTQPVPPTPNVTGGSVAAIVNGHSLPMSTYRALLTFSTKRSAGAPGATPQALAQQTMDQIIADEIIREYAASHHISVSSALVDNQIKRAETQFHGQAGFEQKLKEFGLTLPIYKGLIASSFAAQKVEQQVVPVSKKPQPVAHVRHILVMFHPQGKPARTDAAAHAKALQILKQIQHGGNFAALARQNSDDTGSATKGGDLGNVYPHEMVPEFDHASFTLPLHHPTIVKSMYGYHIVDVLSRGSAPLAPQMQQQQRQLAFNTWLQNQMKHASIKRIAKVQA